MDDIARESRMEVMNSSFDADKAFAAVDTDSDGMISMMEGMAAANASDFDSEGLWSYL